MNNQSTYTNNSSEGITEAHTHTQVKPTDRHKQKREPARRKKKIFMPSLRLSFFVSLFSPRFAHRFRHHVKNRDFSFVSFICFFVRSYTFLVLRIKNDYRETNELLQQQRRKINKSRLTALPNFNAFIHTTRDDVRLRSVHV